MWLDQRSQAMVKNRKVRIRDTIVEYSITRSARRKKTVGIRIAQGRLEVAAPSRVTVREIEAILLGRGNWILAKLEASESVPQAIRFISGEYLPFLGGQVELVVEEEDVGRPAAHCEGGTLLLAVPSGLPQEEHSDLVRATLIGWYRKQAMQYLQESVERWLPAMGMAEAPRILVREQRSRWGSCSADGTLRFSWRLAMMDPDLIDSVVVHELAHLEVMNHSPAFWEVVLRAMPDAHERRKRLNEKGQRLPL